MKSAKDASYFRNSREELHVFASNIGLKYTGRLLDIGCAAGADASVLRAMGAAELHGIEPELGAASEAEAVYDRVFCGPIEEWQWDGTRYHTIVLADVLEHLMAPEETLVRARDWLRPDGHLLISIPNVRHISVLWELFVRGDWSYRDSGILDSTHVRFFTRRSFVRMLDRTGFRPVAMQRWGATALSRMLERLLPGTGELLLSQVFFIARATEHR